MRKYYSKSKRNTLFATAGWRLAFLNRNFSSVQHANAMEDAALRVNTK